MTIADQHCRLERWRVRFSKFEFTVTCRTGLVNQVLYARWTCTREYRNYEEVGDDIPTLETNVSAITRSGAVEKTSSDEEEDNEDEMGIKYAMEDLCGPTEDTNREAVDAPLPINLQEVTGAQICDECFQKVWASQSRGDGR